MMGGAMRGMKLEVEALTVGGKAKMRINVTEKKSKYVSIKVRRHK